MSDSVTSVAFYCFQITGYLEKNSSNQFTCLESEGQFILESHVMNFDRYSYLLQRQGRTLIVTLNSMRNSVSVREGSVNCLSVCLFVYLFVLDYCFTHDKRDSGCPYTV